MRRRCTMAYVCLWFWTGTWSLGWGHRRDSCWAWRWRRAAIRYRCSSRWLASTMPPSNQVCRWNQLSALFLQRIYKDPMSTPYEMLVSWIRSWHQPALCRRAASWGGLTALCCTRLLARLRCSQSHLECPIPETSFRRLNLGLVLHRDLEAL